MRAVPMWSIQICAANSDIVPIFFMMICVACWEHENEELMLKQYVSLLIGTIVLEDGK